MRERLEKIRLLCADCAPKPDPRHQETPLHEFLGKHCKLAFSTEEGDEYMWVRCNDFAMDDSKELRGALANQPIVVDGLRLGDWIEFRRSQIVDLSAKEEAFAWTK
jgi:hypothetical protein